MVIPFVSISQFLVSLLPFATNAALNSYECPIDDPSDPRGPQNTEKIWIGLSQRHYCERPLRVQAGLLEEVLHKLALRCLPSCPPLTVPVAHPVTRVSILFITVRVIVLRPYILVATPGQSACCRSCPPCHDPLHSQEGI